MIAAGRARSRLTAKGACLICLPFVKTSLHATDPRLDLTALAAAAGGRTPALDPTRIFWSGGSLGGIMGAMTVAVEPEIRAAALQVPGASFIQLLATNSPEFAPLGLVVQSLLGVQGREAIDEFPPAVTLSAGAGFHRFAA